VTQDEVRTLVAQALTGATSLGDRVFLSRSSDLGEEEAPGIAINSGEEESELQCNYPRTTLRRLPITVKVFTKVLTEEEDAVAAADAVACEIEAILSGERFGGKLLDMEFKGKGERSEVAGKIHGSATLEFEASYFGA
jgi:hypothetical protein